MKRQYNKPEIKIHQISSEPICAISTFNVDNNSNQQGQTI